MCSIMGYCGTSATLKAFRRGFEKTISRGPDDSKIIDTGKGLLGFHRLAIMGLHPEGMQPFCLEKSYLVCNGEIYGFERFKRNCPKSTPLKASRTAKYCFRCIKNTA